MRGKIVLAVVAVACVVAAWLYLSPTAMGSLQQLLAGKQTAAADKPAAGANAA